MKLFLQSFILVGFLEVLCSMQQFSFAQARLVIGNTGPVYMKMNGGTAASPIYLVIDNDDNTAIVQNSGWVISEGEFNYLKWNVKAKFGQYIIPWGYGTTTSIPLILRISAAGTETAPGSASITFSTYHTAAADNLPLPTSPAGINLSSTVGGGPLATVDRFWSMDAQGFVVNNKPVLSSFDLYYDDAEWQNSNTDIPIENDLQAQRWNPSATPAGWEGNVFLRGNDFPADDATYLGNQSYVQVAGPINSGDFHKWWVLVNKLKPLPVEFLSISVECDRGTASVIWSTASEQNADFFTVERSSDGTNFSEIETVPASGNSSSTKKYSFVDTDPISGTSFYRIRETDFNGSSMTSSAITLHDCSDKISMTVFPNPATGSSAISVSISGIIDSEVLIVVTDMLGREFYSKVSLLTSENEIIAIDPTHQLAAGVYTVIASSKDEIQKRKIVIQ